MTKRIESNQRMSQIVIKDKMVFLSGQTAIDMSKDITGQTQETLAEIDKYLAKAGTDKNHILSATIYLKNIAADFNAMNKVWEGWIPADNTPARATVQAEMCCPEYLVEISIIAYLD